MPAVHAKNRGFRLAASIPRFESTKPGQTLGHEAVVVKAAVPISSSPFPQAPLQHIMYPLPDRGSPARLSPAFQTTCEPPAERC